MFNFIKKLFAKEEIPEEKLQLNELAKWLDDKAKPLFNDLNNNINYIINKINNEKLKAVENIKKLETAKLQNPKIPERVLTIMQGNREAFIKKTTFFFNNTNIKLNDDNYNELIEKSNELKREIESLGKATARSFQVLNEFFAREVETVAINIKNIENNSKEIVKVVNNSKIKDIDKLKGNIDEIKNKIELQKELENNLSDENNALEKNQEKKSVIESNISEIKSSEDYKNYETLLKEKEDMETEKNNIENRLFHDFSALDKAFRKYSKIAFENENLILNYVENPTKTLMNDNNLEITKILNSLEKSVADNKLELDPKKSEKTLSKIKELNNDYFVDTKNSYKELNNKLQEVNSKLTNNNAKNELDKKTDELNNINSSIENEYIKVSSFNNELEKINIEKLKEDLQKEINEMLNAKVTVL